MKYGTIEGLETPVARLVLGSMVCQTNVMDLVRALLDAYVQAGGNCIDTAKVYGSSEDALGQWLTERGNRERILLLTKGAHPDQSGSRVNPQAITADIEDSLRRLQTDTIDLWLLHRDDPSCPVGPILECLNAHKEAGRIRLFGVSNWTTERLQEANDYAAVHGLQGFSVNSPYFGLAVANEPMWGGCTTLEPTDWEWHRQHQFPLFPWSAQAGGFFTGRYSPENQDNPNMVRVYYSGGNWERLRRAQALAEQKGCTANNIALAYVLHQPFPVFPLFGPRTVAELEDSLPALDVSLTADEIHWLNLQD
jgi:aryl-alcohol dehydrogenase-like predicted oxidoreductase